MHRRLLNREIIMTFNLDVLMDGQSAIGNIKMRLMPGVVGEYRDIGGCQTQEPVLWKMRASEYAREAVILQHRQRYSVDLTES